MLLGVLGGFAEYFSLDATLLRIIFIVFLIATGLFPGVLLYLIAALLMNEGTNAHPSKPSEGEPTHDAADHSAV